MRFARMQGWVPECTISCARDARLDARRCKACGIGRANRAYAAACARNACDYPRSSGCGSLPDGDAQTYARLPALRAGRKPRLQDGFDRCRPEGRRAGSRKTRRNVANGQ